ncbi:MAG: hypothetical protein WA633_06275, partial [Stellaceae bacterium]
SLPALSFKALKQGKRPPCSATVGFYWVFRLERPEFIVGLIRDTFPFSAAEAKGVGMSRSTPASEIGDHDGHVCLRLTGLNQILGLLTSVELKEPILI